MMEERIAEQLFAFSDGKTEEVLAWLRRLGCTIESQGDGSWRCVGLTGMIVGLMAPMGWPDLVPLFGLLLAGTFWPQVWPGLPRACERRHKARKLKKT